MSSPSGSKRSASSQSNESRGKGKKGKVGELEQGNGDVANSGDDFEEETIGNKRSGSIELYSPGKVFDLGDAAKNKIFEGLLEKELNADYLRGLEETHLTSITGKGSTNRTRYFVPIDLPLSAEREIIVNGVKKANLIDKDAQEKVFKRMQQVPLIGNPYLAAEHCTSWVLAQTKTGGIEFNSFTSASKRIFEFVEIYGNARWKKDFQSVIPPKMKGEDKGEFFDAFRSSLAAKVATFLGGDRILISYFVYYCCLKSAYG